MVSETKTQECMSISVPQYPIIFQKNTQKILKQHFYKNVILKIAILHLKSIIFEHIFDRKAYYIQKYTKIP